MLTILFRPNYVNQPHHFMSLMPPMMAYVSTLYGNTVGATIAVSSVCAQPMRDDVTM